jgi:prolyl-tRNA synthetase
MKDVKHALSVTRAENFPEWYQAVVRMADLAESSPVRGCMVIKPWGYGIWELIQKDLDRRIKDSGHENCYFPLFIPQRFIAKEAKHVDGFAKEMAVVTHHRLKNVDGELVVDPDAKLEEPLVVRPTSETIIGDAFARWVKSYRDLPLLINQWANVVRWEMRPRLFLRTAEFLWQEGHTAHANRPDAVKETRAMLKMYREVAEKILAMPVVAGEKPENERFPGAVNTYSIEAMMQDGKALQAGTSHYLGTNFAEAQGIRYQSADGGVELCHTTSWGVSTRLIGGVIMIHGDDDGLRLPPKIAPKEVVIIPMLRGKPEDAEVLAYCQKLQKRLGRGTRVQLDTKDTSAADKRWNWVRRGVPVIVEVGPRDAQNGVVSVLRRDRLRTEDGRINWMNLPIDEFVKGVRGLMTDIQNSLYTQAKERLDGNIRTDLTSFQDIAAYFGPASEDDTDGFRGWVQVPWCKPTGAELDAVEEKLKALKLTIRNAPLGQSKKDLGPCVFTGKRSKESILIARAY